MILFKHTQVSTEAETKDDLAKIRLLIELAYTGNLLPSELEHKFIVYCSFQTAFLGW